MIPSGSLGRSEQARGPPRGGPAGVLETTGAGGHSRRACQNAMGVALTIAIKPVEPFLDALPQRYERLKRPGNSLAVTAGQGPTASSPQVVVLDPRPQKPGASSPP